MENKRDRICIIMAGYKKEMEQVLEMNRGLSSRINYYIDFEDLSSEQLYNIFKKLCREEKYRLQPKIRNILLTYFESSADSSAAFIALSKILDNTMDKS